jgi:hypothetical protein
MHVMATRGMVARDHKRVVSANMVWEQVLAVNKQTWLDANPDVIKGSGFTYSRTCARNRISFPSIDRYLKTTQAKKYNR